MEIRVRGDLHHRLWECAGHTFSHATEPGASAEKANTTVCDHSISATTLSVSHPLWGGSSSGWVEGHACVALYQEEAGGDNGSFPSWSSRSPLSELFQPCTIVEETPAAPDLSRDPPACDANCPTAGTFSDDFW